MAGGAWNGVADGGDVSAFTPRPHNLTGVHRDRDWHSWAWNRIFVAPNNSTLMGSAPKHRQGIAGGILATARYIGMILGVGISGAIFTTFIRVPTQAAFFSGIQISFLVASAFSCLGCITSAARK